MNLGNNDMVEMNWYCPNCYRLKCPIWLRSPERRVVRDYLLLLEKISKLKAELAGRLIEQGREIINQALREEGLPLLPLPSEAERDTQRYGGWPDLGNQAPRANHLTRAEVEPPPWC
jgi:hypothetical protein